MVVKFETGTSRASLHEWLDEYYPYWEVAYGASDIHFFSVEKHEVVGFFRELVEGDQYDNFYVPYRLGRPISDVEKVTISLTWPGAEFYDV